MGKEGCSIEGLARLVSQPGSRSLAAPLPADGIAEVAVGLTDEEQWARWRLGWRSVEDFCALRRESV